jgi:hypothetical protein
MGCPGNGAAHFFGHVFREIDPDRYANEGKIASNQVKVILLMLWI